MRHYCGTSSRNDMRRINHFRRLIWREGLQRIWGRDWTCGLPSEWPCHKLQRKELNPTYFPSHCNQYPWMIIRPIYSYCQSSSSLPTRGPKGNISCTRVQCATFIDRSAILFFWSASANQRPRRQSCFSDRPENHKLCRGHWDLSFFQVSLNSVQRFQREVENVSANQRPRRPSCFFDRLENKPHNFGIGPWDLASCQVSLNSIQWFQRRSRKCLSQSEASAAILFFPIGPKITNFVEDIWDLAFFQVSLNSIQWFQRRSRKCLSQSEARAAILFFPIGPKITNFVEDIEILHSFKFRWIPFSGFRGEVENVSANQRPGRPFCFSDRR